MKITLTLILLLFAFSVFSQQAGSFIVQGDIDKFYPIIVKDGLWNANVATELELGRADVHLNSDWRGSLIAKFRFHSTRWGNGARFVDADIMQINNKLAVQAVPFIASWVDATTNNASFDMIIWLRGGGTTYYFKSDGNANPKVFDGVQNSLPAITEGGISYSFKTSLDLNVNSGGLSYEKTAYFLGLGNNYFAGNVGIGTVTPDEKLTVNGKIHAKEVRIDNSVAVPDYVFEGNYPLAKLSEVEKYIKINKHLPDVPSASEVAENGVNVNEMQMLLLRKIEELTLHLIEKDKHEKLQNSINHNLIQGLSAQQKENVRLKKELLFLKGRMGSRLIN